LFAGIYEVSAVLGISSVTTFVVLVIMLYGNLTKTEENTFKAGSFILLGVLRFIFLALGIGLSTLMLYLTNGDGDKMRLFYSIIAIVPIGVSIFLYTVRGQGE
jgi:hypothetical protein